MLPRLGLKLYLNRLFFKEGSSNECTSFSFQNFKALIIFIFFISVEIPNLVFGQSTTQVGSYNSTFTLKTASETSAGVYAKDSTLVRTLWSLVKYQPGTYQIKWDGNDDSGNQVPVGDYTVKVISNNTTYTWEGVIGNNSTNLTGPDVWANYGATLSDMAAVGNYMYCTMWFSEYTSGQMKFNVSTPNQVNKFSNDYAGQGSFFVAANKTYVFYGGQDYEDTQNFIFATKVADDTKAAFSSGVAETPTKNVGLAYSSVLDKNALAVTGIISGMALQQSGSGYLFVAHKNQNIINVYKTSDGSGSFVRSITITNPTNLEFEGDNYLWIAQGTTLTKYMVNSDGTITTTGSIISGFSRIAGLDVFSGDLCVLDAGNQQIVKRYNSTTLASTGSIGQVGGYATSPAVANDKFYEEDTRGTYYTFVRHQSDGSIWIGDPGNCRYQHFSSAGTYINNIMFLQQQYCANVCLNQPTQVFSNFMEYTIDYSKPVASGWTLTNNWGYNQPAGWETTIPINQIILMPNGRRYAIISKKTNVTSYFAELANTGLRIITTNLLPVGPQLDSSGNLYNRSSTGVFPNQIIKYNEYKLTGFDGNNNPTYSSASMVAIVPLGNNSADPSYSTWDVTKSGILVLFNNALNKTSHKLYHLSGFSLAHSAMSWRTCPETFTAYTGDFPRDGTFDIGNSVTQPGNEANVIGNNIFFGYHGEMWKGLETGMIYHYNTDGLLLGLFGVLGEQVSSQLNAAPAGYAGNTLSLKPVKIGSNIYIYGDDEKLHSGLHRWKITGLNTISEQVVPIQASSTLLSAAVLPGIDLLAGLPYQAIVQDGTAGWNRSNGEDYTNIHSKYFTVATGVKSYLQSSLDVYVDYRQPVGVYTVTRDLDNTSSINSWSVSGQLSWERNYPNDNQGQCGGYVEILDNSGRVIARFYETYSAATTVHTDYIYGNDKILLQTDDPDMTAITQVSQRFEISAINNNITFKYAGYSATTSNLIDPLANWKAPKTFRLYFWTNQNAISNDKIIDIKALKFVSNKLNQTITFNNVLSPQNNAPPFTLISISSANLPVTYNVISGPATISGNTLTVTGVGTVVVQASQPGNSFYNPAPTVTQTFTVTNSRTDL